MDYVLLYFVILRLKATKGSLGNLNAVDLRQVKMNWFYCFYFYN